MFCKRCGSNIADGSLVCPVCGERFAAGTPRPSGFFSAPGGLDGSASGAPTRPPAPTPVAEGAGFGQWGSGAGQGDAGAGTPRPSGFFSAPGGLDGGASGAPTQPPAPAPVAGNAGFGKWGSGAGQENAGAGTPPDSTPGAGTFCRFCGARLGAGDDFCGACGAAQSTVQRPAKKRKKLVAILLGAAAAVTALVLVLVLWILPKAETLNGPMAKILSAVDKTLNASSFSGSVTTYDRNEEVSRTTFKASVSTAKRDITAIIDSGYNYKAVYKNYYVYNIYHTYDEPEYFKDDCIYSDEYGWCYVKYGDKKRMSDDLSLLFDAYNAFDASDVDLEKMTGRNDSDLYDDLERKFYVDKLEDAYTELMRCLNDEQWLEENAGYKCTQRSGRTTYSFRFDSATAARCAEEVCDIMRPAIRGGISRDYVNEVAEALEHVYAEIVVESGYLTAATFSYDGDSYELRLYDIGKTKIDTNWLDRLLAEVEKD